MPRFKITYNDPETNEQKEVIDDYDSLMWAKDHAYSLADKGYYKVHQYIKDKFWSQVYPRS